MADGRGTGRGLAVLLAATLAAGMIAPALGAVNARKLAKKTATKVFEKRIPPLAIEEGTEFVRFGPIKLSVGQADVPIASFGPLSFSAHCEDADPTADVDIHGQVLVTTSRGPAGILTDDDTDPVWEPAEGPRSFSEFVTAEPAHDPGQPPELDNYYDGGWVIAPGGYAVSGYVDPATNLHGADCWFAGELLQEAPS